LKDRVGALSSYYKSKKFQKEVVEEAMNYCQGANDVLVYYNHKISKMENAKPGLEPIEYIDAILEKMNNSDRIKVGYREIKSTQDLNIICENISKERKAEIGQINTVHMNESIKKKDDELLSLQKLVNNLQEQLSYVNNEGRGRNRGRGRGGSGRGRGEFVQPDICIKCKLVPPSTGFPYCRKCYDLVKSTYKPRKNNSSNHVGLDDSGSEILSDDYSNAASLYDGLNPESRGIDIEFSKRTKFISIECKLGKSKAEGVVMIDTGASISLVDEKVPYIRESIANTSIRFGNGSTQIAKSKRLICIYVNSKSFLAWAFVTTGLPTQVILGMDFLSKRSIIDLRKNNIRLFSECINASDVYSAVKLPDPIPLPKIIEGTELLYDDYPFMRNLPIGPDADGCDFRALLLQYIYKYKELEKKMVWIHNDNFEFSIDSDPNAIPIHHLPIVYNGPDRLLVEATVRDWYEKGVIRKSLSPWAHQVLIAQQLKPVGDVFEIGHRVCPNLIPINSVTKQMSYPLPNPREIVDRVTGKFKSVFDGSKGYLRFKMKEEDKFKTAFIVQNIKGLGDKFEFNFMPWGAMNAGRFYQEKVENNLRPTNISGREYPRNLKNECAEGFQDDIILHEDSRVQHFEDVKELLDRLYNLGIPINWKKVKICVDEITYCGYLITPEGIIQDSTRVKALSKMRPPANYAELDIFMGMANCHREFIKDYASIMKPLLDLQNKDRKRFRFPDLFNKVHINTFNKFIELIQKKTLLSRPGEGEYHIYTDMSEKNKTLSAQLIRVHEGKSYLISYASKRLSQTECSYSTPKLEMMAIWYGCMKFKMIVTGRKLKVFTDHRSLQGLHLKDPRKRWATWLTDIIEINPQVIHVSGKNNPVADAMTRLSDWANAIIVQRQETRAQIVKRYHHHFSDRKTVMNIRDKYDWDGIYSDVAKCRESCEYCQRNRGTNESRNPMIPIHPQKIWQIIGIDIKGPITLKNQEKKQYGIAVDYFSKYTFIFSLSSYRAKEFWEKFESNILDKVSTPEMIIGDSASQFLSAEAGLYKVKYNFSFQPSTACRHQANGEVENKIKFVDKLMHSYLSRGTSWRDAIRATQKVINQEVVNDSTLFTPYEIVNGHKFISAFDNQVQQQVDKITRLHKEVRQNIDLSKIQQQHYYNKGKKVNKFKEGDWVLVYDNYRKGYQSDMRKGPYRIEKVLCDDNYLIFDHNLFSWKRFNVEKLKLYVPSLDALELPLVEEPKEYREEPMVQVEDQPPPIVGQPAVPVVDQLIIPVVPVVDQLFVPIVRPNIQVLGRSLRSNTNLPGKTHQYMYRKDTYT